MKVYWTDFAKVELMAIYHYYSEVAGKRIAKKIKEGIFEKTRYLSKHPDSGHYEGTLINLNEGHRYLVSGHHKIVYKAVNNTIYITDIFDTRQDPQRLIIRKK
jgi:toxin ParE1/3/4